MSDTRLLFITHEEMCIAVAYWLGREVFQTDKAWDVYRVEVRGSTAPSEERDMFKITLNPKTTKDTNVGLPQE